MCGPYRLAVVCFAITDSVFVCDCGRYLRWVCGGSLVSSKMAEKAAAAKLVAAEKKAVAAEALRDAADVASSAAEQATYQSAAACHTYAGSVCMHSCRYVPQIGA
jgi:hypothetical protein